MLNMYNHSLYVTDRLFRDICDYYDLVYCSDVDNYCERSEATYIDSDDEYVIDTYGYHYCEHCDRWVSDWYWNSSLECCEDCEDNLLLVKNYHFHKGYYHHYGSSPLEIGVEVETDTESWSADREKVAQFVYDILGDHVYFEEDGSLSDEGFEIISQPHDLESFKALRWRDAFKTLIENDYRAHDTDTCGLHVHFSKHWLGETEAERVQSIAKLVMFYDKNFETLYKLSRRSNTEYCRRDYAYDAISASDVLGEKQDTVNKLVEDKKHGSRYTAVNLTCYDRHGTIEFRLGRGTLNYKTFMAWIDLHRAICEQSRTAKTYRFEEWINADTVEAETMEYINKRLGASESLTEKEVEEALTEDGGLTIAEIMEILADAEQTA